MQKTEIGKVTRHPLPEYVLIDILGTQEMVLDVCLTSRYREGSLSKLLSYSDAKRPCSTCVRSHSHALAHVQEGSHVPPSLECTFDEGKFIYFLYDVLSLSKRVSSRY